MWFGFVRKWFHRNWFRNDFFDLAKRLSEVLSSPRQSLKNAAEGSLKKVLPGVVVTSSRSSRRRISSVAATQAFAVATSGETPKFSRSERLASTPGRLEFRSYHHINIKIEGSTASPQPSMGNPFATNSREQKTNEYTIVNTASTMRVLNVLRHWLTKHPLVRIIIDRIYYCCCCCFFLHRIFIKIRN